MSNCSKSFGRNHCLGSGANDICPSCSLEEEEGRGQGLPVRMECGDLRALSGARPGRCASANATPRTHAGVSQKPVPQATTPRARSSGSVATGALAADNAVPRGGGKALHLSLWIPPGQLLRRSLQSPRMKPVSRLSMAARDKESLLGEIIQLKKELIQQGELLRMKHARSCATEYRNRKLEMDLLDLENTLNVDGPRTGCPHRLRAKLQTLQSTVEELQDICDSQREELLRLRRDIRVTRMREVEIERDGFASEVKRLQKVVKRLQTMHNKMSCENRDLGRFKTKCQKLEMVNQRLESCISAKSIKPQAQPHIGAQKHNMVHFDTLPSPRRDRSCISSRQGQRDMAILERNF